MDSAAPDAKREAELWDALAADDRRLYLEKVAEYGHADLEIMGAALERLTPMEPGDGIELAIAFYALGKVARLIGAYADGRKPSDDTWADLTIYAMMARMERRRNSQTAKDVFEITPV